MVMDCKALLKKGVRPAFGWAAGIAVAVTIVSLAIWDVRDGRKPYLSAWVFAPPDQASDDPTVTDELKKRYDQARADRRKIAGILERIAILDPMAQELANYHYRHAVHAVLIGNGNIAVVPPKMDALAQVSNDPFKVHIVVASADERKRNGLEQTEAFHYDGRNTIYVPPPNTFTPLWYGTELAHRLFMTRAKNGRPASRLPDPVSVEDDATAWEFKLRLIDEATHGRYLDAIRRLQRQKDPQATLVDASRITHRLFDAAKSQEENETRGVFIVVSWRFMSVEREGLPDEIVQEKRRFLRYAADRLRTTF